jgi:hypothetical protein
VPIIDSVNKELRPVHENVTCDVCGRTILKGERTEPFLAPGGKRHSVCDLCFDRAEQHGWIREAAAGDAPSRVPRPEPRRPLLGRLRRRRAAPEQSGDGGPADASGATEIEGGGGDNGAPQEQEPLAPAFQPRSRPKDPRHVRAVPTTAEVKVERALELFNGSHHKRTIAGLARTLGPPRVSALPDLDQPSAVSVVVAWELSWYRFRIDLGDEADPVVMLEKGEEIDQIDESLRHWNATMGADGQVVAGIGSER